MALPFIVHSYQIHMKQFFKMMFASALGFFLASMLVCTIMVVTLIGLMAGLSKDSDSSRPLKSDESVMKITFSGSIPESMDDNPLAAFVSGNEQELSMRDLVLAIRNAKEQDAVKGIYLDMDLFSGGIVTLDAIRRALVDFKESGKFIVAYADLYTQGGYYLASVADKVFLNPEGTLRLNGLASETLFLKGTLAKVGVEMMVFRVGTYKGAVEPFLSDKLSDANREQITSIQQSIWSNLTSAIAKSRKITPNDVNRYADAGGQLLAATKAIEYKLVDELKYRSEVEKYLMEKAGQKGKKLKSVGPNRLKQLKKKEKEYRNKIAVVYAEGEITSDTPTGFGAAESTITERLNDDLKKLADNDDVKAVVLRVNSPGGSAYVSEQIWKAVVELKKKKPVIVSMGSLAASGGYYISAGASKIVAEPNTLTGSIGIFGLFPNMTGLFKKAALTMDVVKTNRYADFGDPSRPMTDDEKALMQSMIERGYDTFLTRCADGRGKRKADIDSIAQGRVWTGEQALKLGLVDELGGLERAIELASEQAKVINYNIMEVSSNRDYLKEFFEKQMESVKLSIVRDALGEDYEYVKAIRTAHPTYGVQARMTYTLKPL